MFRTRSKNYSHIWLLAPTANALENIASGVVKTAANPLAHEIYGDGGFVHLSGSGGGGVPGYHEIYVERRNVLSFGAVRLWVPTMGNSCRQGQIAVCVPVPIYKGKATATVVNKTYDIWCDGDRAMISCEGHGAELPVFGVVTFVWGDRRDVHLFDGKAVTITSNCAASATERQIQAKIRLMPAAETPLNVDGVEYILQLQDGVVSVTTGPRTAYLGHHTTQVGFLWNNHRQDIFTATEGEVTITTNCRYASSQSRDLTTFAIVREK